MPKRRMQLASPCDNRWEDLEPRDGGRYCADCDRVVVDLMQATAREAFAAFDGADGDLCVRIREDLEGDAIFRREPPARRGLGVAVLSAALAAACGSEPDPGPAPTAEAPAMENPPGETATEAPATQTAEASPAPTPATEEPAPEALPEEEHPAHPGEPHTALHDRHHGRMGSARVIRAPRGPDPDDPLSELEL